MAAPLAEAVVLSILPIVVIPPPPPPAGVPQTPSPRQNVVLDAPEPLLRFVTGRFPENAKVKVLPLGVIDMF